MPRRIVQPTSTVSASPTPDPVAQARRRVARAELERRRRLPAAVAALSASLERNPKQLAFVQSEAKRIVTCAGRRSGKTRGVVARALRAAVRFPGRTIPVCEKTLTCASAVEFWRTLHEVDAEFDLGIRFNNSLLRADLDNGATILLAGVNTTDEADKLRGGHYPEALVDEAGTLRPTVLEYLVQQVLEPALMDEDGTLVLAGTPSPRRIGMFFEACTRAVGRREGSQAAGAWELHHWTFRDNDALPLGHDAETPEWRRAAREAWFTNLLASYGWTVDSPWVRREYLGEWVEDTEGLIYRLAPLNHLDLESPDLEHGEWRYGLGIDFGYDDPCAFVVVAWRKGEPWLWVIESFERPHLIPSAVAGVVERLRIRYRFSFIVGDFGGYGKGPAEEMRQRWGIPVEPAKKRGKEAHVAFVNGDLASGIIRILPEGNPDLIEDMYALRRAEGGEWAEDERDDNHLTDAFLYACMQQRSAVRGLPERPPPERGSREWYEALDEARMQRFIESERARTMTIPDDDYDGEDVFGAALDMLHG